MHLLRPGDVVGDLLDLYDVERAPGPGAASWVMANMVGGLDGTAAIAGRVGALSDETDALLFRSMRSLADVVLVGAETARRERYGPVRLADPLADRRVAAGKHRAPPLAVVSRSLALDWAMPLFAEARAEADPRPIVVTCSTADPASVARAEAVADVVVAGDAQVDLAEALAALRQRWDARTVLCEGGPTLLGQVAAAGLLDELCLTISPVLGGDALPLAVTPAGGGLTRLALRHVAEAHGSLYLRYERDAP